LRSTAFTVCFIDTHAKRDCGYDDFTRIILPLLLNASSVSIGQPSVKMSSQKALRSQPHGNFLGFCTGVAVDDPCLVWTLLLDEMNDPSF
jgi:hypothetical protein